MTNFLPEKNRPTTTWLTPERSVFVMPILAGLALAATMGMAVITPQVVQLRERRAVVDVLEQKSEALPGLVESLAQRRLAQAEVIEQQQRLLALIAGTADLETFLAQLNDLANKHQVLVTSTKPGAVERAPAPGVPTDSTTAEDLVVGDPLLIQGLEKRSARIVVEGAFVQVLAFLQSLEKLEVFVVTNDLSVVAARASKDDAMQVRLGLELLAYGAANLSSVNADSSSHSP